MDSVGYNGRMTVEGETVILTHDGFVAKVGGLSTGQPRRIPLQAISAVAYKPASLPASSVAGTAPTSRLTDSGQANLRVGGHDISLLADS